MYLYVVRKKQEVDIVITTSICYLLYPIKDITVNFICLIWILLRLPIVIVVMFCWPCCCCGLATFVLVIFCAAIEYCCVGFRSCCSSSYSSSASDPWSESCNTVKIIKPSNLQTEAAFTHIIPKVLTNLLNIAGWRK